MLHQLEVISMLATTLRVKSAIPSRFTNCVVNVIVTQCCCKRKQEQGAAMLALQHNFDLLFT